MRIASSAGACSTQAISTQRICHHSACITGWAPPRTLASVVCRSAHDGRAAAWDSSTDAAWTAARAPREQSAPTRTQHQAGGPQRSAWEAAAKVDTGKAHRRGKIGSPVEACTVARRQGLRAMYGTYTLACLLERTWRFAQPFMLVQLGCSLGVVVQFQFLAQLVAVLSAPAMGHALDAVDPETLLRSATLLQNVVIGASAGVIWLAHAHAVSPALSAAPLSLPTLAFLVLTACTMLEKMASLAFDVIVERDWIVALTGIHRQEELAEANSMLRRIDQLSETAGSMVFGTLYMTAGSLSIVAIALFAAAITPLQQLCNSVCVRRWRDAVRLNPAANRAATKGPAPSAASSAETTTRLTVHATASALLRAPLTLPVALFASLRRVASDTGASWRLLLALPVLPVSLAYTVCFFNVALAPGGVMTAFLAQQGASPTAISFMRSFGAAVGFCGTLVATRLVAALGVLNAGAVSCAGHAAGVLAAGMLYWAFMADGALLGGIQAAAAAAVPALLLPGPLVTTWVLWAFALLVSLARGSVWVFEIIETQIFQTATPKATMVSASASEAAMQSMAELLLLGLAAVGLGGHNALVATSQLAAFVSIGLMAWWLTAGGGRAHYAHALRLATA